jgi:hypothetical protein
MAVSVDTVYQVVLSLMNKEQRGYLPPENFNLFANQIQVKKLEQYFYDIDLFEKIKGNSTEYSDMIEILQEKLAPFEKFGKLSRNSLTGIYSVPSDLYRIGTLTYNSNILEQVNKRQYYEALNSPAGVPSDDFPIYTRDSSGIKPYGASDWTDITKLEKVISCFYIKKPSTVIWNYTKVGNDALYNATGSVDFELHESEIVDLVIEILLMAGVEIKDVSLYEIAVQEEIKQQQQEKT